MSSPHWRKRRRPEHRWQRNVLEAIPIKQLSPSDIDLFQELMTLFGDAFEDTETYTSARPATDYVERLLEKGHFIALVALKENTVIGGLVAYELEKFEQERSEVYIYDLAVAKAFRRQGVATSLIERLKEIASTRRATVIFVQADYVDPPAVALYTKLGTREDVLHFDIPVVLQR